MLSIAGRRIDKMGGHRKLDVDEEFSSTSTMERFRECWPEVTATQSSIQETPPAPRWDGNMSGIDASVVL